MFSIYHFFLKKSIFLFWIFLFLLWPFAAWAQLPNDDGYVQQQPFWRTVNAEKAWEVATGSPRIVVAIIDNGADIFHPDLNDNIWINPFEIPNNGIDDDRNGYIDDMHGWNFVENNNDVRTSVFDARATTDTVRHGTIIAGLIGAEGNNTRDAVGVNWSVKIMPLRVIDSAGFGWLETVAEAVDYAVDNGAMIINLSVVSDNQDDVLQKSLRAAYEKGIVIVAAAGNDAIEINQDNPVFPVCADMIDVSKNWLLGVGSVQISGQLSWFSNYGACVDLYAPGENIYSLERYAPLFGYPNVFGGPWRGTSFSTPIVAGAAALLKSVRPDWQADEIIHALTDSGQRFYLDTTRNYSARILDISAALNLAVADRIEVAPNFNYYYYFVGNEIRQRDRILRDRGLLARIAGATIMDLNTEYDFSGHAKLAVLLKREQYYYVRLYKDNGVWWNEFAVNPEKNNNQRLIPSKIAWDVTSGGLKISFSGASERVWVFYDMLGNRQLDQKS